jgi:4-carboxymuconolactone decarboxylase
VNDRSIALVLGGMLVGTMAGAALGPVLTHVEAQSAAAAQGASAPKPLKYRGRDTRLKTPRISPVDPKDFTREQKAIFGNGGNLNLQVALHNPGLAQHWWDWLRFVHDNPGTRANAGDALPLIDKELVVMRTNYLCYDDWVWGVHVPMAKAWGRSDEEIARIAEGPGAPTWNEKDRALLRAADELHFNSFISDETWKTLTASYNTRQVLDIIFLAGVYHTNAFFTNSVGLPFQPGFGGLPPE